MPSSRKTNSGIKAVLASGYTAIEEYINEPADLLVGGIFSDGFESGNVTEWSAAVP